LPGRAARADDWYHYQIAVDGRPRSYRDRSHGHPHAEVTVRDLITGDTVTIKKLPPGYEP
jgi:hypothetical protein